MERRFSFAIRRHPQRRRTTATGLSILVAGAVVTGCGSAHGAPARSPTSQPKAATVHTNQAGTPIAPYVRKSALAVIMAYASWDKPSASFGNIADVIFGRNNNDWVPVSFVERMMRSAGIPNALQNDTLNFQVPSGIGVDKARLAPSRVRLHSRIGIALDGTLVAAIPYLKANRAAETYLPIQLLLRAIAPIHLRTAWKRTNGQYAAEWDIATPFYGLVTAVTSGDSGHFTRTSSAMTIVHDGENWIPFDFIANSLGNARAGITVNAIGNMAGVDITVPAAISVNWHNMLKYPSQPKHEVPIEINHRLVGYASDMVPKFGPTTEYLSSAEIMRAVARIGLTMHWNHTAGTFTKWTITEPASP